MEKPKKKLDRDKLKAIFNLSFYLLLILFLILAIRAKPAKIEKKDNNYEQLELEGFNKIAANNFEYTYLLSIDDLNYVYSGSKFDNKDFFTLTSQGRIEKYFIIDNIALINKDDNWVLADFPNQYFNFFDTEVLEKIISNSLFSKENNQYEISTSFLLDFFDPVISNKDLSVNTISLTYTNKTITAITMDISSLAKHYDENVEKAILELNYLKFANVKDFDIKNN